MATKQKLVTFPVVSFRHLETPYVSEGLKDYFAVVDITQLPDLSGWRKINVRDPKMRGSVPTAIRDGLANNPDLFLYMNRGLVIAAEDVVFDNKTNQIHVTLSNPNLHGLLDGGHSYNIMMDSLADIEPKSVYVKIEILTGFDREEIRDVVDARNTSNQVKDESLMNLEGAFDPIKRALKHEDYASSIAYKEYEVDSDGNPLPIDIRHVISILYCFDKDHFGASNHPTAAYTSKASVLKHFASEGAKQSFEKIYPLSPELLTLYDYIYEKLPKKYSEARALTGEVSHGNFGNLTGVTSFSYKEELPFSGRASEYNIPKGFIYPILAAFRVFLIEQDGVLAWDPSIDPFELMDGELGKTLATTLSNYALDHKNPNKTGKDIKYWSACYSDADNFYLKHQIAQYKAKKK